MHYEVRYQIAGDEFAATIDADDAATAAQAVQEQFLTGDESFELIQVQLLDEPGTAVATDQASEDTNQG
jgi:hypothetical protein